LAGWGVTESDTATLFRLYQDTHLGGEGCHSSRYTATPFRLYQDTHLGWVGCHRQRYSHTFEAVPGYTPWLDGVSQKAIQLHFSDCTRIHTLAGRVVTAAEIQLHLSDLYTPWLGWVSQEEIQLHSSDCTRIHTLAGRVVTAAEIQKPDPEGFHTELNLSNRNVNFGIILPT
jgi:hypothetical protein